MANLLLGVNQGLTWSTTVIMKIDLVGPVRRGLATGINEAAGYGAVAFTALVTGWIAAEYGLRPGPFLLGLAYACLGLGASVLFVRETRGHVEHEQAMVERPETLRWREVFWRTTLRDRNLSAASQAGLVNNLNDGMAWGLLPLFYASAGLSLGEIGVLAATYPAVWAVGQVVTGGLSDRIGRKPLIVGGMLVQAGAIAAIALGSTFLVWFLASAILGLGTAMVYPTLLAAIADVADPVWRGSAIGVYRLWRDLGFAIGALRRRPSRRPLRDAGRDRGDRGGHGWLRARRPRPDARDARQNVTTLSAASVHSASCGIDERQMSSTRSASVKPRASMHEPHVPTSSPLAVRPLSIRPMLWKPSGVVWPGLAHATASAMRRMRTVLHSTLASARARRSPLSISGQVRDPYLSTVATKRTTS